MCAPSAASELWSEYIAAAFFSRVLFRWPFSADKAGRLAAPSLFLARVSGLALSSERQRWSEIESALFIILVKRQQKRLRPFSQVIAKTSPSAVPLHDIRIFNAFKWCFFFFRSDKLWQMVWQKCPQTSKVKPEVKVKPITDQSPMAGPRERR